MSDDGYTLVEMLAALAIIGLAFSGLVESGRIVGQLQREALAASRDVGRRAAASHALEDLLSGAGPFRADDTRGFDGSATRFSFDCADDRCGARLELRGRGTRLVTFKGSSTLKDVAAPGSPAFRFGDEGGTTSGWPLAAERNRFLRTVTLEGQGRPLVSVRLTTDEPRDCVFDVVSAACRSAP